MSHSCRISKCSNDHSSLQPPKISTKLIKQKQIKTSTKTMGKPMGVSWGTEAHPLYSKKHSIKLPTVYLFYLFSVYFSFLFNISECFYQINVKILLNCLNNTLQFFSLIFEHYYFSELWCENIYDLFCHCCVWSVSVS